MGQIQVEYNVGGIEGLCVITPKVYGDKRGYFTETYNAGDMRRAGFSYEFVQDNQSGSAGGGLRGLHYQIRYPQTKLVRVISGCVYDVAVDLRQGSKTYGKHYGVELSAENRKQFLIPRGFAHGFLTLSEHAEFCYKCDDFYHPDDEGGVACNDPALRIAWPGLRGEYPGSASAAGYRLDNGCPLTLSEKDQHWKPLSNLA